MPIQRTEAAWPVVYDRVLGQLTPDDTVEWLAYLVSLTRRKEPCALIVDFRAYEQLSHDEDPKGTKIREARNDRIDTMRAVLDEHRDALRDVVKAVCYIVPAGPLRAILSGMLMTLRPPYPTQIVGSLPEAQAFCQGKLEK